MNKLLGLLVAGVVTVGTIGVGTAYGAFAERSAVTVVRVIDGDTLVAKVAGRETTIRLLNVDTPETKDPNQAPECLGPEATDFLTDRLPAGTRVDLKYDKDRTDRYGRTLAAVYESGSLVNAEIARNGFGAAVLFEPNRKYYGEVLAAQQAAQAAKVGLHDGQITCTLPAQVERVVQALQQTSSQMPVDSAAAAAAMNAAAVAVIMGEGLESTLNAVEAGGDALRSAAHATQTAAYRTRLTPALARARQLKEWHQEQFLRLQTEETRLAEEARLAEETRKAEEARVAEEARLAEETRKAAAAAPARPKTPTTTKRTTTTTTPKTTAPKTTAPRPATTTAPANPYPGYTGPRCYAPGGKTWKPC